MASTRADVDLTRLSRLAGVIAFALVVSIACVEEEARTPEPAVDSEPIAEESTPAGYAVEIIDDCHNPVVARDGSSFAAIRGRTIPYSGLLVWKRDDGAVLYELPTTSFRPNGISSNGQVVVGKYAAGSVPGWGTYFHVFRWTADSGMETLEHYYEADIYNYYDSVAVSGDGDTIAAGQMPFGTGGVFPVMWDFGVASAPFHPLPEGYNHAEPITISEDGSRIWGWLSERGIFVGKDFFEWSIEEGTRMIIAEDSYSEIIKVAPETGLILVRTSFDPSGESRYPIYIIDGDEAIYLPEYPDESFVPWDMTAEGDKIVGLAFRDGVIWRDDAGYVDAKDWIEEFLKFDLTDLDVTAPAGISANGDLMVFSVRGDRTSDCIAIMYDEDLVE